MRERMMVTRDNDDGGVIPTWSRGWRMRRALQYADVSVQDMADYLEVGRDSIRRWTHDVTPVKRHVLVAWALATGVDLEWLEHGKEPRGDDKAESGRPGGVYTLRGVRSCLDGH